jgi:hypothetical protein
MFRSLILLVSITCTLIAQAQQPYMPRDVKEAFKKGTRAADGRPGKNYWQNRGRYDISITAAPPNRTITGNEQISYTNNSPDTLNYLVFRLIVNIHKPGAPRLGGAGPDYLTSGVHIDSFVVNGQPRAWNKSNQFYTAVPVRLPKPLMPHDSVNLAIKWHYDMSLQSNREGMIDSTTFYLAYFYPRVSVYDDYQGWDMTSFNDALEFYNDFNDYTLQVQVPENYIVWGTGTLLNPTSVLQPTYADRFRQSLTSDQVIRIVTPEDLKARNITAKKGFNTWQFKANNVPDMALGLSDHFVWDAGSVVVDDANKRRASVQSAYNDTAADFHHMVGFGKEALDWLSHVWPGIAYPYEKTTIFQGYAGMEYPMMANDETYGDTVFSRFVAQHEIAHTYMPFYMGINETRYGFMDEGWATTFELLFNRDKMPLAQADDFYKQFRINEWINDRAADEDLPIITPGPNLNGGGLGNNEYGKPSLGYLAVKDMLGDDLFKKCLHEYMARWNGRHPLPWDFFNTFNNASGRNLDWFWSNWFCSNYYIDLSVKSLAKTSSGYKLTVDNIGGMAAPFDVIVTFEGGGTQKIHQSSGIWQSNQKQVQINLPITKLIQSVTLDGGIFMDADESNNVWRRTF